MMREAGMNFRSLAGNMFTAFAAQGVSVVASLVMSLLVPKALGVEAYGYWQLFVFYASYSGFFHLGLNDGVYLVEGGKTRDEIDKRSINSQFVFGFVFQLAIGSVIAAFAVLTSPAPERTFVLLAFAFYMVMYNTSACLGYVFQAMNETKLFSYSSILERVVFLVPLLALVVLRVSDFAPYVFAYLASKAVALFYTCWNGRDILSSGLEAPIVAVREAIASIRVGFGLMLANVASMLILGVARALVDYAWGVEVFGRVSFSLSIVNFFLNFVSQASMVLFPALRQGTESERRSFYKGIRDMMEVAFPGVYLLYFPVAWLLALWLPQYAESMRYFAILLPLCAFDAKMDICCTTYLKVIREERVLLRLNLVTVAGSAAASVIGIYELDSLDSVLLGVVACIIARSLWCERYLDGRMDVASTQLAFEEVCLTVVFIALALLVPAPVAITCYAIAYAVYLLANRGVTRRLFASARGRLGV